MKRAQRMEMVQQVVDDQERRRAETLAASERQVRESERKLAELEAYLDSYSRDFKARLGAGMNVQGMRDYQAFLGKLNEAIRQQTQIVFRVRTQRDAEQKNWQGAAQRAESVGRLVQRWQADEQRVVDKRDQAEADERAQRPSHLRMQLSGA